MSVLLLFVPWMSRASCSIEQCLQFVDRVAQLVRRRRTWLAISITLPCSEIGGTFSTSGIMNWAVPCSAYFSSSSSRICAGLGPVLLEEVLLLLAQPLGPLAAGAQRGVEGEVAEQVERVGVGLVGGLGQLVEVDAALRQACDDRRRAPRRRPSCVRKLGGVAVTACAPSRRCSR